MADVFENLSGCFHQPQPKRAGKQDNFSRSPTYRTGREIGLKNRPVHRRERYNGRANDDLGSGLWAHGSTTSATTFRRSNVLHQIRRHGFSLGPFSDQEECSHPWCIVFQDTTRQTKQDDTAHGEPNRTHDARHSRRSSGVQLMCPLGRSYGISPPASQSANRIYEVVM